MPPSCGRSSDGHCSEEMAVREDITTKNGSFLLDNVQIGLVNITVLGLTVVSVSKFYLFNLALGPTVEKPRGKSVARELPSYGFFLAAQGFSTVSQTKKKGISSCSSCCSCVTLRSSGQRLIPVNNTNKRIEICLLL